ncbi:hypothetical protein [Companilactobacillus baiquanensis]|uniref:Uncharacterized protein n=1 Tax=Companilactobacillus baiquanensis TaxID=2486005 RepID=A0ABW1UYM2_9LACO|nr:hypothetical protein [Companilactobacillus baiquanensis]
MYISDPELFADYLNKTEKIGKEKAKSRKLLTDLQEQISIAKFNQMSSIQKSYVEPIPNDVLQFLKKAGISIECNSYNRSLTNVTNQYIFSF